MKRTEAAPARGTTAYRRRIITLAASEGFADFRRQLELQWPHYGWRLTVDTGAEMLASLGETLPLASPYWNSFGKVALSRMVPPLGEAMFTAFAVSLANGEFGDLPPHEGFTQALKTGEYVRELTDALGAAWQEAMDAMQAARWQREPGIAVLTALLAPRANRDQEAQAAAYIQHCMLRQTCLPAGKRWIGAWLARPTPSAVLTSR